MKNTIIKKLATAGIEVTDNRIKKSDLNKALEVIADNDFDRYSESEARSIANQILDDIAKKSKELVKKFEDSQVENSSVPTGPDTTKFRSVISGEIKYVTNDTLHGGHYGVTRFVSAGVRVGSGVDKKVREEVQKAITSIFSEYTDMYSGDSSKHIRLTFDDKKYGDGYWVTLIDSYGSAYSTYGVEVGRRKGSSESYMYTR